MKNSAKTVVENMFAAFNSGDADKFVATVSDDTVWIYHGTQIIPKGRFEKKEGVRAFIIILWKEPKSSILNRFNISLKTIWLWY